MSQDETEMSENEKLAADWAENLEAENAEEQAANTTDTAETADSSEDEDTSEDAQLADEWASALAEDEQNDVNDKRKKLSSEIEEPQYKDLTAASKVGPQDGQKRELDFILDIPLDISAELGRTRLLIKDLLQLGQGSVIELNKLAGEPLEVFVNGKLVARGEAVVVNEKFGVRLTDIISPIERITQIG